MQLNLFTDIICGHCKKNPGFKPGKPHLWNGFLDRDTMEYVCWGCKNIHYAKKQRILNLGTGMIFSEIPVPI